MFIIANKVRRSNFCRKYLQYDGNEWIRFIDHENTTRNEK